MDPLTISLSVIGAVKVAWKGALETKEFIDSIKGAPTAVNRLSQDLTALYTILGVLHSYFDGLDLQKQSGQSKQVAQVAQLVDLPLKNCINAYADITLLIRPFIKPSGDARTSKWKGIKWNFKEKEVVALQTVLISYKVTLEIAVGVANLTTASHEIRDAKDEVKFEVKKQIRGLKRYLDAEQESVADTEVHGSATGTDYNYALKAFLKDTDSVIQHAPAGMFPSGIESLEDEDEEADDDDDDDGAGSDMGSDRSGLSNLGESPSVSAQGQHAGGSGPSNHPQRGSNYNVRAEWAYRSTDAGDLSFLVGQVIRVTDAEEDEWYEGWYVDDWGVRREGMFPKSFVSDPLPAHTPFLSGVCHCRRHEDAKHVNGIVPSGERMRATADFDTNRASELSVRKGDVVANIARIAPLWWLATNSANECGFVPAWRLVALSDTEADSSHVQDPVEARSRHADVFSKWKRPAAIATTAVAPHPPPPYAAAVTATHFSPAPAKQPEPEPEPEIRAVSVDDYAAAEDNEVSVCEGETVTVVRGPELHDDWWLVRTDAGKTGLFPSNWLTLVGGHRLDEASGAIVFDKQAAWAESFAAWSGKKIAAEEKEEEEAAATAAVAASLDSKHVEALPEPAWKDAFAAWSGKKPG